MRMGPVDKGPWMSAALKIGVFKNNGLSIVNKKNNGYYRLGDVSTRSDEMALISKDFLVSSDSGNNNPYFTS